MKRTAQLQRPQAPGPFPSPPTRPVIKKPRLQGTPLPAKAKPISLGYREPFGPPATHGPTEGTGKPHEEVLRKHTEDYNMRQAVKATLAQANAVSYGFYSARNSKNNNMILPAIPRK